MYFSTKYGCFEKNLLILRMYRYYSFAQPSERCTARFQLP